MRDRSVCGVGAGPGGVGAMCPITLKFESGLVRRLVQEERTGFRTLHRRSCTAPGLVSVQCPKPGALLLPESPHSITLKCESDRAHPSHTHGAHAAAACRSVSLSSHARRRRAKRRRPPPTSPKEAREAPPPPPTSPKEAREAPPPPPLSPKEAREAPPAEGPPGAARQPPAGGQTSTNSKSPGPKRTQGMNLLGYLDSNQEQLNQNQSCCQLHHTPMTSTARSTSLRPIR